MKSNLLKKHAKSFYWASFFLSSNTLDKCSSLYNFCRTLDDIVDDNNNLKKKKEIFRTVGVENYVNRRKRGGPSWIRK